MEGGAVEGSEWDCGRGERPKGRESGSGVERACTAAVVILKECG